MRAVEAVVFDIGNVLIEWQPERYYDRVVGPERRRAMFEAVDLHAMNDRVDRGENFRDVVYGAAEDCPDFRDEILMWHDNWLDLATPIIAHSVALLRALRARGVPVFALSNFGIQTFALARKHYAFLDEFDRKYISGHMGVIKPDTAIYQMLEEDCGFAPETLLFTDDRTENIEMARDRGWQVHQFDGPQGWATALVSAGLLTTEEVAQ